MSSPQSKLTSFAKVVVFFAVAFGIGLGLCGLDYFLAARGIGKPSFEYGVGPLDGVSLVVLCLSALGLVVTTILWIIVAVVFSTKRNSRVQLKLAEKDDDHSPSDNETDSKRDDQ